MVRSLLPLFALGAILALGAGCGKKEPANPAPLPGPVLAKSKNASTPEEAVAFLLEASKADNRDDYYGQLAAVYGKGRDAKTRLKQASQVFDLILAKKFGAAGVPEKPSGFIALDWDPNVIAISAAEVIAKEPQKEEGYLLRVKVKKRFALVGGNVGEQPKIADEESEERFIALQEGGVWKLVPLIKLSGAIGGAIGGGLPAKPTESLYERPDLAALADEAALVDKLAAATEQVTKDMEADTYATAKDAQETRAKKMQEILNAAGKKLTFDKKIGVRVGTPPPEQKDSSDKKP